ALVAPFDAEDEWKFLTSQASELYLQGSEFGDNEALVEAIAIYKRAIAHTTSPLSWAMTQHNLGIALQTLGAHESGTERLEEAKAVFREALKEYTRERVPLDWAMTQTSLGNVLKTLGERESGTETLEEAVAAYREALKEWTRERVPLDW